MPSSLEALDLERTKLLQRMEKSGRAKSPVPASPSSSSHNRAAPSRPRRVGRRTNDYGSTSDTHTINSNSSCDRGSKDYEFNYEFDTYESPTESLTSSLSSSFQIDRSTNTNSIYSHGKREKDHVKEDNKKSGISRKTKPVGALPSEGGPMIEISKITVLVEEELQTQRDKHKDQLNRTIARFKERQEKFRQENDRLRAERGEARRELEKCKKDHAFQLRAAERNDRLQSEQSYRIGSLEDEKELFEDLQAERDALLDEIARSHQQQQQTREELSGLKMRIREDSQKRLSVMESLSISWNSEQKEAKQKEALLNSELDIITETLNAEKEVLKNKNNEFDQLGALHRSTKKELRSVKMAMIAKQKEMDEEIKRLSESHMGVCEEHKTILKLKNDELLVAENTIRNMKAELKSTRGKVKSKEESMATLVEEIKKSKGKSGAVDPEVKSLHAENRRLKDEIEELQRQMESYLANMALQQEFCDSLKSRIYDEQENEQGQVEEIHKLKKRVRKQQKEAAAKDFEISQLKQQLLGKPDKNNSGRKSKMVKSKSSMSLAGDEKKSILKKLKGSRKGGYKSS